MNTRSASCAVLIGALISAMVFAPVGAAQAPAGQHAGEIARLIPSVDIARGTQQLTAELKTPVDWGDVVQTQPDGRARVGLDDGSVLNVGADSTLEITQHNSAQQQTQIDLTYGRVRATVVKFTRPGAKFEVRTAVGVAGVVGGDGIVYYENDLMSVIDMEGLIHFCNNAGACVDLIAGQISFIRGSNAPDAASQATPEELAEAIAGTSLDYTGGNGPPSTSRRLPIGEIIGLTVLVAIPGIVLPIALRSKPAPAAGGAPVCPVGVSVC
jgi:ferric-dicitrate binding protein FerR (iron transport regulator)